jgi:glutathione S-transferase
MNWVALEVLLAVLQSAVFGGMVAVARSRYKVSAPAISGNEVFERYFRVHYNSNEQLIIFLPSLWLFSTFISLRWAAILGAIYLVGRVIYAVSYIGAPTKRSLGFNMTLFPNVVLLLGALYGVVRALLVNPGF